MGAIVDAVVSHGVDDFALIVRCASGTVRDHGDVRTEQAGRDARIRRGIGYEAMESGLDAGIETDRSMSDHGFAVGVIERHS